MSQGCRRCGRCRRCWWSRWRVTPAFRRATAPRARAASAGSKSASRSSTSSRPTETRTSPARSPPAASCRVVELAMRGGRRVHGDRPDAAQRRRPRRDASARRGRRPRPRARRGRRPACRRQRAAGAARRRPAGGWRRPGYRHDGTSGLRLEEARERQRARAWRSMRTCSVSMPRSTRKAANGATMPPVSISTSRIRAISSRVPATAPASTSE